MPKGNKFYVYLSYVGEQDPISEKTGEKGSLLTCFSYLTEVRQISFDSIYIIPTSKRLSPQRHTEERAERCAQEIKGKRPDVPVSIKPLEVRNPADLREVYPRIRDILKEVIREVEDQARGEEIEFHLNVSSGTPQMKESFPFLVSIKVLEPYTAHLWQVFDPRGGITAIEERVRKAPEMSLLAQERLLLLLEQLTEKHMYQTARDWLSFSPLEVEYLYFARSIYSILAAHDQWRYGDAYNALKNLLSRHGNEAPDFLKAWLGSLLDWLKELSQNPPEDLLSTDRYFCACRRFESESYPDALSHFWTACELALTKYGRTQGISRKSGEMVGEFIGRLSQTPLNRYRVHFQQQDRRLLEAVDWLRNRRNEVEHGSRPVDKGLAQDAGEIAEGVLKALNYWRANCPVHHEKVKGNLHELIQTMRGSLWR